MLTCFMRLVNDHHQVAALYLYSMIASIRERVTNDLVYYEPYLSCLDIKLSSNLCFTCSSALQSLGFHRFC